MKYHANWKNFRLDDSKTLYKDMVMTYRLLFISKDALITDIAWQCTKEGHQVRFFIENKLEADIGDGFIEKVETWEPHVDWADVIILDDVLGHGTLAQTLRQQGKLVVGGTSYTDRLEDDRSFGQNELKKHGVAILPYEEFDNFDKAIAYVKANPAQYVIKPSGEAQNIKRLLFVGQEHDGSDVCRILDSYKRVWAEEIKIFQLQRRVLGVEVAVGAFFNGKQFTYPININFENKKLFPGNLGPATGEMGTAMFWSEPNKLFSMTLAKFEATLAKEGYVGYIDINCIVNSEGVFPLEFTSRFGYPSISIQQESMLMSIGEFFYQLAKGELTRFPVKPGFQIGVRVVVPPYPFRDEKTYQSYSKDSVVVFQDKQDLSGIHIEDVKLINDQWILTGSSGTALIVVGCGLSMREAQQEAYDRIKNILLPNCYYRTDIGDRWYEEHDLLHSWSYLHTINISKD